MIKEFKNISPEELEALYNEGFYVQEKLDMYYFRVEITKVGAIAMKGSTENVISDIDCITNTMYKDICNFVDTVINPVRNDIITEYGELRVGFFYNPKQRYHIIDYSKHNPALAGKFILSDTYAYNSNVIPTISKYGKLMTYLKLYSTNDEMYCGEDDVIFNSSSYNIDRVKRHIEAYLEAPSWPTLTYLIGNFKPITGLRSTDVEGFIIRSKSKNIIYQITVNDVNSHEIDKSTKLVYRDTVLQSLVNTIQTKKEGYSLQGFMPFIYKNDMTYVDKVSNLFLFYIENTDLFSKYSFDPEDLLPPHIGYMGDVDLDIIPNQNVKILCMHNEVNKNIFRLFLHTFSRNLSENKFSSFVDEDKKFLNELVILLKYKNYKQIMYTAYKANRNK